MMNAVSAVGVLAISCSLSCIVSILSNTLFPSPQGGKDQRNLMNGLGSVVVSLLAVAIIFMGGGGGPN